METRTLADLKPGESGVVAAVGGEDVVVFFQRPRQRVKLRGAENHTAAHGLPSCFFYFTTFFPLRKEAKRRSTGGRVRVRFFR